MRPDSAYSWYALAIMFLVYMLSNIDRQILAILAEDIKADLQIRDEQLGFLFGTAFAIFYGLFGIPLGRLADNWYRTRLMAAGLAFWSLMTAFSGLATSFAHLAVGRIGVGAGEASCSPAAWSMLADYFTPRRRAFVMGIYGAGALLGLGASLTLGGFIAGGWDAAFAGRNAPLGLAGWQVTFLVMGVPGLLLALVVLALREPERGVTDGHPVPIVSLHVWRTFGRELASIIPPFTLLSVARFPGALRVNILALAVIVGAAWLLVEATNDVAQWIAYATGLYAVFSWSQLLRYTDRAAFMLIWGTPAVVLMILAFGCLGYFNLTYQFWSTPYALRTFGISKQVAGLYLGTPGAAASIVGVIVGGKLSDVLNLRDPRGRIFVAILSGVGCLPFLIAIFHVDSFAAYAILHVFVLLVSSMASGTAVAAFQDLVLPRMRGTIGATYLLAATMVGLALGPYLTGKIATHTGSLRIGLYTLYPMVIFALLFFLLAARKAEETQASRFERARAAGEPDLLPV